MPQEREETGVTEVTIFGDRLSLVSAEDDAYAEEIAAYVDERMNAIAAEQNLADTGKIAIMAALEIADRILRSRQDLANEMHRAQLSAERLARCVDAADATER